MKIVFIIPSLKTGGGNRVVFELSNQLCKNYEVVVLYPNNSSEQHTFLVDSRVRVEGIGAPAKSKIGKLWNVWKCILTLNRTYRKDIQVFSDPLFSVFSYLLRSHQTFRFIQADDYRIFDDGDILGEGLILKVYKKMCLWSYRANIKYIFNSRFVYQQYCKDSSKTETPYLLVHPALNHQLFYPDTTCEKGNKELKICLVARKHPMKGLATFLDVYHSLPEAVLKRVGRVILISHDDLSSMNTEGMEIVKPSSDEEIASVYRSSDIFISTSWWEGFGLPPLEAMACGCAVITSDAGGVNEYAHDEDNCLMYEPKNAKQLEERLCRLIENEELRKRLAVKGIQTAMQFNWEKSVSHFQDILVRYTHLSKRS